MAAAEEGEEIKIMSNNNNNNSFIINTGSIHSSPSYLLLQKFRLYETRSNFYMIGRNKSRTVWKVLKIDRLDPSELNVVEDDTTYSEAECCDLLKRINEGNKSTGGLKFVTTCYGIVGFVKFLGPYYMLLITKRTKIGAICGETIYGVAKSEMITIQSSCVLSSVAYSRNEKRYKKLLGAVDLTKDFFFSYSYHVMNSLQKNLSDETGQTHYDSMFVWNEFLTRKIRNNLKNACWTVALVYGFFKQVKLSASGKDFKLTLIARRSRHYAGTRYLKRGVNEKGRVANDVETEQIVFEDLPVGQPMQISSVVQIRGSIPLFWSQETSKLNIKPNIILSRQDPNYNATRLHFENLVKRYGTPIIILNLIKMHEKKPRETILRAEFSNAINFLNKSFFTEENSLRFLHWDLTGHSKKHMALEALHVLGRVAEYALSLTSIFYCQVPPNTGPGELTKCSILGKNDCHGGSFSNLNSENKDAEDKKLDASNNFLSDGSGGIRCPSFQSGVLRTNCIDCLDRTNVAQYAYGLAALGHQLRALGFMMTSEINLKNRLAEDLMKLYENMGDTLALQYGGSAAHNKIFCERRGQWKAATQSQEFFRTLQRYYSNAYMDAEKQDAINVFLGYFQPQPDKPALWELSSDQHFDIGSHSSGDRSFIKRSLSDGNILCDSNTSMETRHNQAFVRMSEDVAKLSDSTPELSACESDISYSRYTPSMSSKRLFQDTLSETGQICEDNHVDEYNYTNFLDLDMISSSGNSCEEDINDRLLTGLSSEYIANDFKIDSTSASDTGSSLKGRERTGSEVTCYDTIAEFSENFVDWVTHGGMLFH